MALTSKSRIETSYVTTQLTTNLMVSMLFYVVRQSVAAQQANDCPRESFARAWNGFMSTLLERVDEALRGHR